MGGREEVRTDGRMYGIEREGERAKERGRGSENELCPAVPDTASKDCNRYWCVR